MLVAADAANPAAAHRSAPPSSDSSPAVMLDLATYTTSCRIAAVAAAPAAVTLDWNDGRRSVFDAIWLRDNCACPTCRHPQALERRFLLIDVPVEPAVAAATLTGAGDVEVRFVPEHVGRFAAGWLRAHDYGEAARAARANRPHLWDAGLAAELPTFEHAAVMDSDEVLAAWLTALCDWGIARIVGAPAVPGEGVRIAGRVGPVRPTNFGAVYDVVSMPDPNASAYTPMGLEPHTDLANWRWPPDYQLLFCVANEAVGGGSILVDGFRVAEELCATDPAAFDILASRPIDFRFHDGNCDIRHRAPTIALDADGSFTAVRFNNWLRAALDLPPADIRPTYRALLALWRLIRDPRFQLRPRLAAGELLSFDNSRVLHGRDPFDPATGHRHLQGCYLDRDPVLSRLRLIARRWVAVRRRPRRAAREVQTGVGQTGTGRRSSSVGLPRDAWTDAASPLRHDDRDRIPGVGAPRSNRGGRRGAPWRRRACDEQRAVHRRFSR